MPTVDDHGFPVYTDADAMPDWDIYANTLGTALGEQLDDAAQAEKDNDSVPTIADLPVTGNWAGRVIMVEENDMLYVHDGTGWYIYGGKLPYFFGKRAASAIGTGATPQGYITTTDYARGVTRSGFELTLETPGIYRIDLFAGWEAEAGGQRNIGVLGTDITPLGPYETTIAPSATVDVSQPFATYILATAPGAVVMPYVTHNTGMALDVSGTVCVMWVSA